MDDSDFTAFGATLAAQGQYTGARGSAVFAQQAGTHAEGALNRGLAARGIAGVADAVAFSPNVISSLSAPQLSLGERMLRQMGWRAKASQRAKLAEQAKEVGLHAGALLPKLDNAGIGYVGSTGDATLDARAQAKRAGQLSHVTMAGSAAHERATAAAAQLRKGLFQPHDDEDDIHAGVDMSQYDIAATVEEEVSSRLALPDKAAPPRLTGPPAQPGRRAGHDGLPALPGFLISLTPLRVALSVPQGTPLLTPAAVPAGFQGLHTFRAAPPAPLGQERTVPTPASRGAALGEQLPKPPLALPLPPPPPPTPSQSAGSTGQGASTQRSARLRSQFVSAGTSKGGAGPTTASGADGAPTPSTSLAGHPIVSAREFTPVIRRSAWAPHRLVCRRHNVPEPATTQAAPQGRGALPSAPHARVSAQAAAIAEVMTSSAVVEAAGDAEDEEAAPLPPQVDRSLLASVFDSSDSSDSEDDDGGEAAEPARAAPTPSPEAHTAKATPSPAPPSAVRQVPPRDTSAPSLHTAVPEAIFGPPRPPPQRAAASAAAPPVATSSDSESDEDRRRRRRRRREHRDRARHSERRKRRRQ